MFAKNWTGTEIARFPTKLFCREGGKRLPLTLRVIRVLDFTLLISCSVEKGVEVSVERNSDQELMLPCACPVNWTNITISEVGDHDL